MAAEASHVQGRVLAVGEHGALAAEAFWRRVHALRVALAAHPARRWALVCEDSSDFALGFFALADARRVVVLPQAPQAGSLKAAGIVVDAVLTDKPADFAGFNVLGTQVDGAGTDATPFLPDDAAEIEFYTSGSSGAPKCVPKAFKQLRLEVEALERQWGGRLGGATVAATVPHYHLYGLLFRVLWPLLMQRPFHTHICLQPADLRAAASRSPCVVVSSPAFLSRIPDVAELPPAAAVQAVFSSGAPLPDAAAETLARAWGHAPIEVYGSTETGGVGWRAWDGAADRPWWRPIQGVDLELREETAGQRLWVRSGCTWHQDWMPTGDLAVRRADGGFMLRGRADDVVKFEDKRLSLSEMRSRLLQHAWVTDARLLLLPGRREHIGAVVVLNMAGQTALAARGRAAVREDLRSWLRDSYEALLVPRKWRFPAALPDNAMGKTEQASLLQLFGDEP